MPLDNGIRLTEQGLALAMAVATMLAVVALVCITTTAWRVTADPPASSAVVVAGR